MKILKLTAGIICLSTVLSLRGYAAGAAPTGVELIKNGRDVTVNWQPVEWEGVDKYQVKVYKVIFGSTNEGASKTATVDGDSTSADLTLSSKGYYAAKVRARDVNNQWTSYSSVSNQITITSDDIDSGGGPGGGSVIINPIGPGSGGGPGGNNSGPNGNNASPGSGGSLWPATGNQYSTSTQGAHYKLVLVNSYLNNGWQFEKDGMWYLYPNGAYPVGSWAELDNAMYHFDSRGYLEINRWIKEANGNWYYVGSDGKMCRGWNLIGNGWYYFQPNSGVLQGPGLQILDGKYYYIQNNGTRVQNAWMSGFYFGQDGARVN